jgi:hypothetical protein
MRFTILLLRLQNFASRLFNLVGCRFGPGVYLHDKRVSDLTLCEQLVVAKTFWMNLYSILCFLGLFTLQEHVNLFIQFPEVDGNNLFSFVGFEPMLCKAVRIIFYGVGPFVFMESYFTVSSSLSASPVLTNLAVSMGSGAPFFSHLSLLMRHF